MSKTIKQIADEIGVSKQAVQKRLSREPLCTSIQPYISTNNGVKYIDVVGENLVKSAFCSNNYRQVADNLSIDKTANELAQNTSLDTVDVIVDVLKSQIETQKIALDTLQAQLEVKDKQIEVKDKQIEQLRAELAEERQHSRIQSDKLAVLADQAQQLQLAQLASSSEPTSLIEDSSKRHWWQRKNRK